MYDCIIIGGGLLGMLSAIELDKTGQRVCLLDRQASGHESTWAGGGIVSPLYPWRYAAPVTALARWGQQRYPALCEHLAAHTGTDPEYLRSGLLVLDTEEQAAALAWARDYEQTVEVLADSAAVHACEPLLGSAPDQALWLPQVGQVRNPRMARALRQYLDLRPGITVKEHTPAEHIIMSAGRVQGVRTPDGTLTAPRVVVAAGAWSPAVLGELPFVPEVVPVKGQMIVFKGTPGLFTRIVLSNRRYLIPRRDGHILAGSTLEHAGFDKHPTTRGFDALHGFATTLAPALAECAVEKHWAGLRPGSPDGVPYIGEHPQVAGLYFNTGHFRNGVVLGLASARLLADLLGGAPTIVDPRPYALDAPRRADHSPDFC